MTKHDFILWVTGLERSPAYWWAAARLEELRHLWGGELAEYCELRFSERSSRLRRGIIEAEMRLQQMREKFAELQIDYRNHLDSYHGGLRPAPPRARNLKLVECR